MNTRPTVSETKRTFYAHHSRPINSVYRRVVEELLVEMHLLRVNDDFKYDAIYALGVVSSFDRFMEGYTPDKDKNNIFLALCSAEQLDAQKLRADSSHLLKTVESKSLESLMSWLQAALSTGMGEFEGQLKAIAQNPSFKYSRLFGIGLYTLIESVDAEALKDEKKLGDYVQSLAECLKISPVKLQKDVEFYRASLDKLQQARKALEDIVAADKKRQEQRLAEKQAKQDAESDGATATPEEVDSSSNA